MSNRVHFQNTKFVDLDSHGKETGEATYGYRAFDSYGTVCENSLEPNQLPNTPEEALECLKNHSEYACEMFAEVHTRGGFEFNGKWYGIFSEEEKQTP